MPHLPKPLKRLIVTALSFFCFCLQIGPVFAIDDFSIDATSTYKVTNDGKTNTLNELRLTNKIPNIYPTQYALSLASTRIEDIWARDGVGTLSPQVSSTGNSTNISLAFKQISAGVGQQLNFSLGFTDHDIAQQIGRVWEINIPRPENILDYNTYTVKLQVPSAFGEPVQILPKPIQIESTQQQTIYSFDKKSLQENGVTAIFGEKQVFSFEFRYALENPSPLTDNQEIALPPDTPYQKMVYDTIIPQPNKIRIDADGNWLANYKLKPNQKIEVHAAGKVIIFSQAKNQYQQPSPTSQYLSGQEPWPVTDSEIKNLALKLKSAENIYNYIVKNLSYDYQKIEEGVKRLGAKNALLNPEHTSCMEFTDLFIALARAAGIPAREINGFAYTQNPELRPLGLHQDILHAWPEYYDKKQDLWIQIDPTWGNTTQGIDYFSRLDLNHFAFVIHGKSSQTPYPVGFYRTGSYEGKDIIVKPSQEDPQIKENLELRLNFKNGIVAGFTKKGFLEIENLGNTASVNQNLEIISSDFAILSQPNWQSVTLLPYNTLYLPLKIRTAGHQLDKNTGKVTIKIGETTYEQEIKIKPRTSLTPWAVLALGLGTATVILAAKTRNILFPFRKK